ncbi:MAG: hypothetical protein ACM358_04990 [Gemmatimonadota bacterium]
MSDMIDQLCALVAEAGGTMRLYGKPVGAEELRRFAMRRVVRRFARIHRQQRQREDIELGWLDLGEAGA